MRLFFRYFVPLILALGSPLSADEVIRIMAANTTSGNGQDYDPGHGNRIFQGLDPDIVLVQEFNYLTNSTANIRAWVDMNFGSTFSYFREPAGNIPNGIVSRYPILASGEWDDSTMTDRDYVWAKIDIPGDKDLWAVSVHLSSGGGSSQRNTEAVEVRNFIQANVPAADYLVIGGDFNTDNRGESCVSTLSAVVVTAGPYPVDQAGDPDTNASRAKPYDWVMPDADLNARKTPLVIGNRTFTDGLVYDSRVTSPYSFLPDPILSGDSGATNMQHMAVMRAFLIPTNDPPVIVSAANSSSTETVTDPDSSVYEIVRGTSVGLTVAASDDAGEAALKYTWSKTAGSSSPVTFSSNGTNASKATTATFQAAGNYTLSVTVADVPGLNVTSAVKIRVVQTASGLTLTPANATLAVNATQTFTAGLTDQFNQPMPGSFIWSASGGGTISASGVFTATTAGGPYSIGVTGGEFARTSSVTVTPASAMVGLTGLSQVYDGNPKPVTVTTTPPGLTFTVSYDGSPTPPVAAGSYSVTATVTDPNYQGSSTDTLVITPDEWALWKNTYFTTEEREMGLAADSVDPDFDGLLNLAEYALGSHPRQFTPPLAGVLDETGFSITFTRPADLPGILYFAETTNNLGVWSPVPLETLIEGPVETVRARIPFAEDPQLPGFLRLGFEREE